MKGENAERWRKLCQQAAVEQHPKRLLELTTEINRLLQENEDRLLSKQPSGAVTQDNSYSSATRDARS